MFTRTYPGSVRFSACTFWPSFVSITCSVGTTTRRNRARWFIDSMRCSRLALTFFSCPEYVLITYHLNIARLPQQDVFDDVFPDPVVRVEVHPDEDAGNEDDRSAAHDLLLRRPFDLLQLRERLLQEAETGEPATALGLALGARRGLNGGDLHLLL